jgi:hypothetical protein
MPFWSKPKPKSDPAEIIRGLRAMALTRPASELGMTPSPKYPKVFGILMEMGLEKGVASLVAFAEDSTSVYYSTGGGIIGAGEHESVRATHPAFFAEAEARLGEFAQAAETPLPAQGRVRFYLRTFDGTLTAEADEQDLGHNRHALSKLFHAGHDVLTAVRTATPR